MKTPRADARLIETDRFPFEFLSRLGERESWRKEVHRPVYHVHKWWAKRLGSVFRGILLGCALGEDGDLTAEFYCTHSFAGRAVFDPFMGSGTTVGEAHKLGFTALGRDINPVAVNAVRVALGPLNRGAIERAFEELSRGVGEKVRGLYRSSDSQGRPCDVLYHFWVMQGGCPACGAALDLFSSWVIARNAYPYRKPEVQVLCPGCGDIFRAQNGERAVSCPSCTNRFDPEQAPAKGAKATCGRCRRAASVLDAVGGTRPRFRLYGKLVLTPDGRKEYLPATEADQGAYAGCSARLQQELAAGRLRLPSLTLEDGYNTRQAMSYGFRSWRDFFNDRQLLALGWLQAAVANVADRPARDALLALFSGALEFNNVFASYKGEGTGAVRHMFSHHVLKPERTPIEANVWGTPKSSGAFSNLFRSRLLRAVGYRQAPTELRPGNGTRGVVCSPPFAGEVHPWPEGGALAPRGVYLSCGSSSETGLPDRSIDLIVTDPPFFDNVHYSELADFFYAWQQLPHPEKQAHTTRDRAEVQDPDPERFATKLQAVFREAHRLLKDEGLFVFTYHHSREEGWKAVADAVLGAGFIVINSQPVKAEMSVATPKAQAKEPIQLDIILVCRKKRRDQAGPPPADKALAAARVKLRRLREAGLTLSRNDRRVVLFGQLLTAAHTVEAVEEITRRVEGELAGLELEQRPLFRNL